MDSLIDSQNGFLSMVSAWLGLPGIVTSAPDDLCRSRCCCIDVPAFPMVTGIEFGNCVRKALQNDRLYR